VNFSFAQREPNRQIQSGKVDMLTTLRIKNLALVEDLTLELRPGYNVITGETGAGKSILIGALTLVLGERADRALIRTGSDVCSVEAVFDVSGLKTPLGTFLADAGLEPCEDGQLVLKRSFTSAGANRQFVNGSPTALTVLAELGGWLVDIHGPHDHQSLLHPGRQLAILDSFGNLDAQREEFAALVRRRTGIEAEKASLIVDERTYAQQVELLRFQTNEITNARLQPDEDRQIEQGYHRASNSARLLQLNQVALDLLSENEGCLLAQAGAIGRTLQELERLDPSAKTLIEIHNQAVSLLKDLQGAFSHYGDRIEVDPERLRQLEERLDLLHSLKRKYGPSLGEVLAFGEEARRRLVSLEQRDAELARLNAELEKLSADALAAGKALSARRRKLIPQLSKAVNRQLADLGFTQSRFELALTTLDEAQSKLHAAHLGLHGIDTLEFQFAPNPGEPIRPLRAIASSGELARVMLALKTVLAAEDQIPVLVFDEVDANVGGETAHAVGDKMRQIAQKHQVLCITHLPQVAAPASAHFLASKQSKAGRTVSHIELLEKRDRVSELARMLGGQTGAARRHAEELLGAS
jgi:DNA repair protein RecN (Recombination protein N)